MRSILSISLLLVLASACIEEQDLGERPDGGLPDAPGVDVGGRDVGPVSCGAVESAGFTLCETTATTCALVFDDGVGCRAACESAGLECVESFDTADGTADVCDPADRIGALGCAETGHGADYCVCGRAGDPDAGPGADGGPGFDGGPGIDSGPGVDAGPPSGLLAFPTARGAGAYITGGRGGVVVPVTRLDDAVDGDDEPVEGTLRYALTRRFPRTIVFRVSGTIVIGDEDGDGVVDAPGTYPTMLSLDSVDFSNFTLAGQTAPEGGITIQGFFYISNVQNMIWRYVRLRKDATFNGFDTISLNGAQDVILDHLSVSYGTDEGATVTSREGDVDMSGITFQYNLIAESKTGSIVGGLSSVGVTASVLNNFYTRISHRFPNLGGVGSHEVINNLVYNWRNRLVNVHNSPQVNHINNAYVAGGWTRDSTDEVANKVHMGTDGAIDARIYTAGNFITRLLEDPGVDNWISFQVFVTRNGYNEGDPAPAEMQAVTPFPRLGFPSVIRSAADVMARIPDEVGAFRTLGANGEVVVYRDAVDETYITEYREGTGNADGLDVDAFVYPTIPTNAPYADGDGDGMPDAWEMANGLNPGADDSAEDMDGDGYTNLEEFLNLVDG